MQLSVENSEAVRELISDDDDDTLKGIVWEGETLAGAVNLACLEKELLSTAVTKHLFFRLLDEWQHLPLPIFQQARRAVNHRGLWHLATDMKAESQEWEIVPTPSAEQVNGSEWLGVERRFEASLLACGFGKTLSKALPGAFHEMADNALRHSGPSILMPARGIVGYCVNEGQMTFCIGDIGRGVLASLRTNPANSALRTDQEAIEAAVNNRATSNAQNQHGDGFTTLHRALADLNGRLRFRSGTSVLVLDGRADHRKVTPMEGMLCVAGFQVTVHCVLDGFTNDAQL